MVVLIMMNRKKSFLPVKCSGPVLQEFTALCCRVFAN